MGCSYQPVALSKYTIRFCCPIVVNDIQCRYIHFLYGKMNEVQLHRRHSRLKYPHNRGGTYTRQLRLSKLKFQLDCCRDPLFIVFYCIAMSHKEKFCCKERQIVKYRWVIQTDRAATWTERLICETQSKIIIQLICVYQCSWSHSYQLPKTDSFQSVDWADTFGL